MSLKEELEEEKEMQKTGIVRRNRTRIHNVIADYTLRQDLGFEETNRPLPNYDLDEDTRDRLIAHARQDACLAVVIASANEKRLISLKRLVLLGIALQVFLAWNLIM